MSGCRGESSCVSHGQLNTGFPHLTIIAGCFLHYHLKKVTIWQRWPSKQHFLWSSKIIIRKFLVSFRNRKSIFSCASPQIRKFVRFFCKSQIIIRKFLVSFRNRKSIFSCASPQIRKFVRFFCKSQICEFYKILHNSVSKVIKLNVVFWNDFCVMYTFELEHYMLYLWGENIMYLRACGILNPKITKKIGPANRKSAKCYICGRSANLKFLGPQICGFAICGTYLRNLFADRPPLRFYECFLFFHVPLLFRWFPNWGARERMLKAARKQEREKPFL